MKPEIFLHEEIMLLALSDEKGSIETGVWYQQAVGGAVIAELLLAERIRIKADGKKQMIAVKQRKSVGNDLVDEWLKEIAHAEKPKKLSDWLSKIANSKDLKARVARNLVKQRILEEEKDKVFFFFNRTRYPEANAGPERAIRDRLDAAIFNHSLDVDARTIALLSLAKSTGILVKIFDKKALKSEQKRIDSLIEGELAGKATTEIVQSIQVALMVACIVPVIVT
ncbi:MAG: hypothetical protein ACI8TQ_001018 [Planctomycetota bacterium]|jgi:hypothetical protein